MRLLSVVLLACALVVGLLGWYMMGYGRRFEKKAVRTRATVVTFSPIDSNGQMAPVVEFTAVEDGKHVRMPAQSAGSRGVHGGDQVEILYERKKGFGLETWNIFIIQDGSSRPFGIYAIVGAILIVIALGLAVAAIVV